MELVVKRFEELTLDELWEIAYIRTAVFIVEQNCPYQDIDERDKLSVHVFLRDEGRICAYLRVVPQGLIFDTASLGRVIALRRREGLGTRVVKEGIRAAKEYFGATVLTIEAQTYAKKFYENVGFVQTSQEYLEDGIPHIQMKLYNI